MAEVLPAEYEQKMASSKVFLKRLVLLLFIVSGCLLAEYIYGYSAYWSFLGCALLVVIAIQMLQLDTYFFLLYFLLIYNIVGISMSLVVIEAGAHVSEVREMGYPIGASMKYTFYSLVMLLSSYCFYYFVLYPKTLKRRYDDLFSNNSVFVLSFYALYVAILIVFLVTIALYGSAIDLGANRMIYLQKIIPPGVASLTSLTVLLSFTSGIIYTQNIQKKWKVLILFIFLSALVILFFFGEKYSAQYITIYVFWLPTLLNKFRTRNFKIRLSTVLVGVVLIAIFVALIMMNYYSLHGSWVTATMALTERIALQGQVWWAIDRFVEMSPDSYEYFYKHVFGFGVDEEEVGLNYLMYLISPIVAMKYFENGVAFTCGFPSILVLGTGYVLGVPIILFCGVVWSIAIYLLSEIVLKRNFLPAVFAFKLFFAAFQAFIMGRIHFLFSIKGAIFLIGALFFYYFSFNVIGSNRVKELK